MKCSECNRDLEATLDGKKLICRGCGNTESARHPREILAEYERRISALEAGRRKKKKAKPKPPEKLDEPEETEGDDESEEDDEEAYWGR